MEKLNLEDIKILSEIKILSLRYTKGRLYFISNVKDVTYSIHRLNSEEPFFPVHIFPNPNRDSDSVKNSESDDTKILTRFPGNPILEISIKKILLRR